MLGCPAKSERSANALHCLGAPQSTRPRPFVDANPLGGTKPWQGPDGVYGDIVAPDTPVSGMITCGTGSPLAGGSGAKVLARGRERGSDLLAEGA